MASYKEIEKIFNIHHTDEKVDVILDTDAFNEQDDQFAIAQTMLSSEKINLIAITAAPFSNKRADVATGLELSYQEAVKVRDLVDPASEIPVFRGSTKYLPDKNTPVDSEAARYIIEAANKASDRIYIIAIGCLTNVASAILMQPDIVSRAAVIWLGGHSYQFPDPREFNLKQDIPAAQIVFASGIPLVQIPAGGVTDHLTTTVPELKEYIDGKNAIGTYLTDLIRYITKDKYAGSKVIWDIAGAAYLTVPSGMTRIIQHTPILTDDGYFVNNDAGEYMVYVKGIKRDPIFADLFSKISALKDK